MGNTCPDGNLVLDESNDATATVITGRSRNYAEDNQSINNIPGQGKEYIKRYNFCSRLSDNEFTSKGNPYRLPYNSSKKHTAAIEYASACLGSPQTDGLTTDCQRIAYRGQAEVCTFRDSVCVQSLDNLYENSLRKRSCPPENRSLSSDGGREVIRKLCLTDSNWIANWTTNRSINRKPTEGSTSIGGGDPTWTSPSNPICVHALYRNIYGPESPFGCSGTVPSSINSNTQIYPDANGLIFGRKLMSEVFTQYIKQGGSLAAREDSSSNIELNDTLWNICSTIPGVCSNSLKQVCNTVTTQDLTKSPDLQKWCGCYMPDYEYSKYTDLYQINKECTPSCNRKGIIPLVNETGINTLNCRQSTCVIDDVSIQLYKSSTGGDGTPITFSQVCGSCGANATCQCTLTGVNFAAVDASIPSINVSQQCNSGTACYYESKDSNNKITSKPIPCSSDKNFNPSIGNTDRVVLQEKADRRRNLKILILILIVVLLLIFIWYFFMSTLQYDSLINIDETADIVLPNTVNKLPNVESSGRFLPNVESSGRFLPNVESSAGFLPNVESSAGFLPNVESSAGFLPNVESSAGFL
jgi:hypothetical protein